jgi:micrococcal nuclease
VTLYTYRAELKKVVDGDTVDLRVDLGFSVQLNQRFRLAGVNTPELHSKDAAEKDRARAAMTFLGSLLSSGPLTVTTDKDSQEKFGRYLARITNGAGVVVNDELVRLGHAVLYSGGKR